MPLAGEAVLAKCGFEFRPCLVDVCADPADAVEAASELSATEATAATGSSAIGGMPAEDAKTNVESKSKSLPLESLLDSLGLEFRPWFKEVVKKEKGDTSEKNSLFLLFSCGECVRYQEVAPNASRNSSKGPFSHCMPRYDPNRAVSFNTPLPPEKIHALKLKQQEHFFLATRSA